MRRGPSRVLSSIFRTTLADVDRKTEESSAHFGLGVRSSGEELKIVLADCVTVAGTEPTACAEVPPLETTQGQIDAFFTELPHKCQQNRVAI